jgi:hypothetical protein
MRLNVKVLPNAKENRMEQEQGRIKVWITAKSMEGKANSMLIKFLSDHYHVPKSLIRIVSGLKSREKLVEIRK